MQLFANAQLTKDPVVKPVTYSLSNPVRFPASSYDILALWYTGGTAKVPRIPAATTSAHRFYAIARYPSGEPTARLRCDEWSTRSPC